VRYCIANMHCSACRHDNPPQAKFCLECGTRMALTCGRCRAELPPSAKFCLECGERVSAQAAPAPESYTPKHLAERILTSKAVLEGERKHVTVVFADLKGSMELLADRDPEEARKILDPVIELMMDAVHRYEGTVNQVMGDGIMALFGAPIAHEDHAVRACYAALRMQDSARRYAESVRRTHGVEIQLRVGMNSGDVVVRSVGSDLRMDYSAVGQTTHLAARMEQLATPGTIRLTGDTLRLAEGYVEVTPLGPIPVKGLATPVEVYEVTGAGPVRTRLQASARRGLTRFVGRDPEMEQLRRAQELAGNGAGQIAAIVGEAGVGKSRLVYEFTHSHRMQGWLMLASASMSYGKASSYLPVIDLLKDYFKMGDRADAREIREKVTGKLLALDRALEPTLPALLQLFDVETDDSGWRTLDPGERRQRTLEAIRRLLLREAREQPLLLLIEDLHWVDAETQALLDMLADGLASSRVLLLVNYRPEYRHPWGSKTYYSQMRLDALPTASAGEVLDALLGEDASLTPLKQLLVKRGNPFFLEETVRTLAESKILAGEPGRYRVTQPVQTIQVPATVQAILAARIDRLSPEDKRLLQTASAVGKTVPLALLQTVAELSEDALRRGLDRLQAAEFLYETGLFPDLEYAFNHALTHDVAYAGLLQERRRVLHAQLVEAIETLYGDRVAAEIERLADHAFRGEMWDKALAYSRQAGAIAGQRAARRDATVYYEQALAAASHLPRTPEVARQTMALHSELRGECYALGEMERSLRHAFEAERVARELDDPAEIARKSVTIASSLMNAGRPAAEAIPFAAQAQRLVDKDRDPSLFARTAMTVGSSWYYAGDHRRADEALRSVVDVLKGELQFDGLGTSGTTGPAVYARNLLVWSLTPRGHFDEAAAYGHDALALAEKVESSWNVTTSRWALGYLHFVKGEMDVARQHWERGLAIAREFQRAVQRTLIAGSLCAVYAHLGRGLPMSELDNAITGHEAIRSGGLVHPLIAVHLGEACALVGRRDDALMLAHRALTLSRARGQRAFEGWAIALAADVEKSEARWREAMALAIAFEHRPLIAHCHRGLGDVATAIAMYREMGMTYWMEKAEART